jgi:hypothetical protein
MDTREAKTKTEIEEIESTDITKESPLLNLPIDLQSHVLTFLSNKVVGNKFKAVHCDYEIKNRDSKGTSTRTTTFFSNVNVLYHKTTEQIAHNLLFHKNLNRKEIREFLWNNQQYLYIEVEVKSPSGQRVRGNLTGILSSAGARNTREMEPGEEPDGLVEWLSSCFKNPDDFEAQREAWEKNCKAATAITMGPYREAIETLAQEIIDSKNIPNVNYRDVPHDQFETLLLNLPIAQKFRNALKPNPDHVVTSGFLFDMQIFIDFMEIFERRVGGADQENTLGGWESHKSDLFDAIVYPALQLRCERSDHMIFKKGIDHVVDNKESPDEGNYSAVFGARNLAGFGVTHCFCSYGAILRVAERWSDRGRPYIRHPSLDRMDSFSTLVSRKNESLSPNLNFIRNERSTSQSL